jgi:hypothetical protein
MQDLPFFKMSNPNHEKQGVEFKKLGLEMILW